MGSGRSDVGLERKGMRGVLRAGMGLLGQPPKLPCSPVSGDPPGDIPASGTGEGEGVCGQAPANPLNRHWSPEPEGAGGGSELPPGGIWDGRIGDPPARVLSPREQHQAWVP